MLKYTPICLVLALLLACSAEPSRLPRSKKEAKQPVLVPLESASLDAATLEKAIKEIIALEGIVQFESSYQAKLILKDSISEKDLVLKMDALGLKAPEKIPALKVLDIEAMSDLKAKLTSRYRLLDAIQYAKGEISRPEWLRRSQITVEETPESLLFKARENIANNNQDALVNVLNQWLKLEPNQHKVKAKLANVLRDQNKYQEALTLYDELSFDAEFGFFAQWNRGFCFEKLSLIPQAIEAYQKALQVNPNQPQVMRQLAVALLKMKNIKAARDMLVKSQSLEVKPETKWIEALILREEKKYKEASIVLDTLEPPSEYQADFLFNRLLLDLDLKDFKSAQLRLKELAKMSPELAGKLDFMNRWGQHEKP